MRVPPPFFFAGSCAVRAVGATWALSAFCAVGAALWGTGAWAQTAHPPPPPTPTTAMAVSAPLHQRTERVDLKDAGARVQELRVGGQTQSITVQPQGQVQGVGALPTYEVQPTQGKSSSHGQSRSNLNDTTGPRVWNVLKF